MKQEAFEKLVEGDLVRSDASGTAYEIVQVRQPGFFVVQQVDPKTFEALGPRRFALTSGRGLSKVERATR